MALFSHIQVLVHHFSMARDKIESNYECLFNSIALLLSTTSFACFFNVIDHMADVFLKLSLRNLYASTFIYLLIKCLLNTIQIINCRALSLAVPSSAKCSCSQAPFGSNSNTDNDRNGEEHKEAPNNAVSSLAYNCMHFYQSEVYIIVLLI